MPELQQRSDRKPTVNLFPDPYPSRKRLDHRGPLSIGTNDVVYFITIAAAERGTPELSDNADDILSAARYYQSVGKWFLYIFLIMPDHIHMLVHVPAVEIAMDCGVPGGHALPSRSSVVGRDVPTAERSETGRAPQPPRGLAKTIGDFKSFLSKKHGIRFQANFFDTRIRDQEHFAEKWNYICRNPVAKGLVTSAREWPHSIAFDPSTGHERTHR